MSNEHRDRCAICGVEIRSPEGALRHFLAEHPHNDLLRETVADVRVSDECSDCGEARHVPLSVGVDGESDTAILTTPSYCSGCEADDPIRQVMVSVVTPKEVMEREVTDE